MPGGGARGLWGLTQLRLPWDAPPRPERPRRRPGGGPPPGKRAGARTVTVGGREFVIDVRRHRWARRYLARLSEDGRVMLTVPYRASIETGLAFVRGETAWIEKEWIRVTSRLAWSNGTSVWWRGEQIVLARSAGRIQCGEETVRLAGRDIRSALQRHWRALAEAELPPRCRELAAMHGLLPSRVSVRDQRSRWGACSSRRAITLNWRLLQMPPFVSDYVILHELAHLEHPNHGRRFWRRVEAICPSWRDAERWLRKHGRELL